ncbi:hypothetical protein [Antarctobacter heliothermus]|uniref:Predicted 5' DNA nuclease, flap endonuclease-1-like, helix-3-turn-helix (H3TH) domain n=1 Tax=Antarctobacter heliothermus TaxID=74033 RepID=A0A239D484_9RHOB|nr:hypothetical protein [Antarctobacter heliothermus]SNS27049.1 Predicted 5' DNA nuclease, flap endonuclease-1-like, helix-3-turn-helix (H3TH) domain [Antarctobacter heliothermus]
MTTPNYAMTPDFTPFLRLIEFQTRFAMEASQGMMKLAMMPWAGLPTGFGSVCGPMGRVTVAVAAKPVEKPIETVAKTADDVVEAVAETVEDVAVAPVETVAPKVETVVETAAAAPKADTAPAKTPAAAPAEVMEKMVESAVAPTAKPVKAEAEPVKAVPVKADPVKAESTKAEPAKAAPTKVAPTKAEPAPVVTEATADAKAPTMTKPGTLAAPKGTADDLTVLNGVGPKLAEALNAEGIYHFTQIAAWSEANVLWVDENLPGVRGRASRNGWVAQAADLAK